MSRHDDMICARTAKCHVRTMAAGVEGVGVNVDRQVLHNARTANVLSLRKGGALAQSMQSNWTVNLFQWTWRVMNECIKAPRRLGAAR